MIEKALQTKLKAEHGDIRCFIGVAPKGTKVPYVVLYPMNETFRYSHDGRQELKEVMLQASVFAASYLECDAITEQVIDSLEITESYTSDGSTITHSLVEAKFYQFESDLDIHSHKVRFKIFS